MFEPIMDLMQDSCNSWHGVDISQIERVDYYMTRLDSDYNKPDHVKLAVRCIMKDEQSFGNIIQIPIAQLQSLIKEAEQSNVD